jgi:hypothetical protein
MLNKVNKKFFHALVLWDLLQLLNFSFIRHKVNYRSGKRLFLNLMTFSYLYFHNWATSEKIILEFFAEFYLEGMNNRPGAGNWQGICIAANSLIASAGMCKKIQCFIELLSYRSYSSIYKQTSLSIKCKPQKEHQNLMRLKTILR